MSRAKARPARPRAAKRATAAGGGAVTIHPLTAERWPDLERLFGPRGACAGCWCMWPRLPAAAFAAGRGEGNRRALRRLAGAGEPPGMLAYVGGEPAAWCGFGPRAGFARLQRSRLFAPIDDLPVWSVVCFFVARGQRGRGLTVRLLREAVRRARAAGAPAIEGYPVVAAARGADTFAWWGLASAFRSAGFVEIARPSPTRAIMRRRLAGGRRG